MNEGALLSTALLEPAGHTIPTATPLPLIVNATFVRSGPEPDRAVFRSGS